MLELAIQQSGDAASKASAEDASGAGKEGASAGVLKVYHLMVESIVTRWCLYFIARA